jgi:hypothetical protein
MISRREKSASRVSDAERFPMPVVIRDTPPGYDWGWYSREDPRMHLQTVDEPHRNDYKVWLETRGQRAFEAATKIPSRISKALQTTVARNRRTIEDHWVSLMIRKGWLQAHLSAGKVKLVAYPNTQGTFTREIDLSIDLLPDPRTSNSLPKWPPFRYGLHCRRIKGRILASQRFSGRDSEL